MKKTNFLIIGNNKEDRQIIISMLNNHIDWENTIVENAEKAIEQLQQQDFDFVLLDNEISEGEEKKLKKLIHFQQPNIVVAQYDGLNAKLIENEIMRALEMQKQQSRASYSISDDVFKL